jgi:hypothetical protein
MSWTQTMRERPSEKEWPSASNKCTLRTAFTLYALLEDATATKTPSLQGQCGHGSYSLATYATMATDALVCTSGLIVLY